MTDILSKIVLDRSKPRSEQHGTRMPDDPWYRVAFMQDGLPFDLDGNLVPDNPHDTKRQAVIDGQKIDYTPLWNDKMRAALAKKIARIEKHIVEPEEPDEASSRAEQEQAVDDVNLELWLKGQLRYEPWQIFAACRKRKGINCHSIAQAVEKLVLEEEIITIAELAPPHRKLIERLIEKAA